MGTAIVAGEHALVCLKQGDLLAALPQDGPALGLQLVVADRLGPLRAHEASSRSAICKVLSLYIIPWEIYQEKTLHIACGPLRCYPRPMSEHTADSILQLLKVHGPQTAKGLSVRLAMTPEGARQHLAKLQAQSLVSHRDAREAVGRPKRYWRLTERGHGRFPDGHSQLMLDLVSAVRGEFGEAGLDRLIAAREKQMLESSWHTGPPYDRSAQPAFSSRTTKRDSSAAGSSTSRQYFPTCIPRKFPRNHRLAG